MSNISLLDEMIQSQSNILCSVVETLPYSERCHYVRTTEECITKQYFINYIKIYYCLLNPKNDFTVALCAFGLISLCVIAFMVLGSTADKYFCPALKMLSNDLGLSEHIAGVTLLAFGNGSPDLFTTIASLNEASRSQFSDLIGAAIFVNSFTAGVIIYLCPFEMQSYASFRDSCFMLFGIIFIDYSILSDGYVTLAESICVIMVYVMYIIVLIVDQLLVKKQFKEIEADTKRSGEFSDINNDRMTVLESQIRLTIIGRQSKATIDTEYTKNIQYQQAAGKNENLFSQFFKDINPFDAELFKSSGYILKLLVIWRIIPNIVFGFTIPITDYELDRHGWSKLLNIIHIILTPYVLLLLSDPIQLYGTSIANFSFLVTVPIAIYVFYATRTDVPPRFHSLLSVYACCGSMYVIYMIANETVEMLFVLGLVTNCSSAFLGCSLLAWGNSAGDLVANIALALGGYTRMGFAACIGGPFFNSILGMGIVLLYQTSHSETLTAVANIGPFNDNCIIFFVIFHLCSLIWMSSTNFMARRSVGVFSVILYLTFILYLILNEANLIQTFAADAVLTM